MSDLIVSPSTTVSMSTREIATLCDKEHRHVVRDLKVIADQCDINLPKFGQVYIAGNGQKQTEYLLDRTTTLLLVSGYSAPLRLKIINRLEELERGAAPRSFADALQLAADQQREIERQQAQLEAERPYAEIGHVVTDREAIILREWIALLKSEGLKIKEKEVIRFLIDCKCLYRDPNGRLRAYADCDHLFTFKYGRCADGSLREFVHITGLGVKKLYPIMKDFAGMKKA